MPRVMSCQCDATTVFLASNQRIALGDTSSSPLTVPFSYRLTTEGDLEMEWAPFTMKTPRKAETQLCCPSSCKLCSAPQTVVVKFYISLSSSKWKQNSSHCCFLGPVSSSQHFLATKSKTVLLNHCLPPTLHSHFLTSPTIPVRRRETEVRWWNRWPV